MAICVQLEGRRGSGLDVVPALLTDLGDVGNGGSPLGLTKTSAPVTAASFPAADLAAGAAAKGTEEW